MSSHGALANAAASSSSSSSKPIEANSERHNARSHGVKVSSACTACRQRRSKCSGHLPCSLCKRYGTPCQYNESLDRRRRPSKRKLEDLQLDSDMLDDILSSMKSQEFNGGNEIVNMVRGGMDKDDLRGWLDAQQRNMAASKLRRTMSIERLCDQPLVNVPASPWTNITDDDGVVSHLVSLHLAWPDASVFQLLDHELFVRDMTAGNLSSPHCSPLLVNAVLASGCHFCTESWACAVPSNLLTRGLHFFEEAMRLWQAESFSPSITGLQALTILSTVGTMSGRDRVSQLLAACIPTYSRQVEGLQMDWLQHQYGPSFDYVEVQRSQQLALWGAFRFLVAKYVSYKGPTDIRLRAPRRPNLSRSAPQLSPPWTPFPAAAPRCIFSYDVYGPLCDQLFSLGAELFNNIIANDNQAALGRRDFCVDQMVKKLDAYYESLPHGLTLRASTAVALHPLQYDILLGLHWYKTLLCGWAQMLEDEADEADESERLSLPFVPQDEELRVAKEIAALVTEWRGHYGTSLFPTLMPWACAMASIAILDRLEQEDVASLFHELWIPLVAIQDRWSVFRGIGRMIFVQCVQKETKLRPETIQLIEGVANRGWRTEDVQHFAANEFPIYGSARQTQAEFMRDFLLQTSNLSLRNQRALPGKATEPEKS